MRALLPLALGAAASAADVGCRVRVVNMGAEPVVAAGTSVAPRSHTAYLPLATCGSQIAVASATGEALYSVQPFLTATAPGAATLVHYGGGVPATVLLGDATAPLPDASTYIDMCQLRVTSGLSVSVTVGGVTSFCGESCAHWMNDPRYPPMATGTGTLSPAGFWASPADASGTYAGVYCGAGFSLRVESSDGKYVSTQWVNMREHGSYTVVVPADGSPFTVLTDNEGHWPYTPLVVGSIILLVLGFGSRFLGRCLGRRFAAGGKKDGYESWAAAWPRAASWAAFLGWHKAARKAVEAAKKSDGGASDLSTGLLAAGSLNGSSGGSGVGSMDVEAGAKGGASSAAAPAPASKASTRIRSIDTLRGACLCIMVFVNYGGGGYWFFDHSSWNGLTVADLVFPIFVFTQGVSMAISFAGERKRGASKASLLAKIVIRAAKLYGLGLFVNQITVLSQARVLGVLQYFAMAYLIVGTLETLLPSCGGGRTGGALWTDVGQYAVQWAVMAGLGLIYLCLQYFLQVPGCPTGYLGAGGLSEGGAYWGKDCTGGAHRLIDVTLFGINHIYHNNVNGVAVSAATCSQTDPQGHPTSFVCDVHDPEGALGWVSAAWMTWLGLQAGRIFVNYKSKLSVPGSGVTHASIIKRLAIWGVVFGLLGSSLAGFSRDGGIIPINKNLWSPSFIFVMSGIAYSALSLLYYIVDVLKSGPLHFSGAPFIYPGMNSIVVYVTSETLQPFFPFSFSYNAAPDTHAQALATNLIGVAVLVSIARIMYLKRVFVNV